MQVKFGASSFTPALIPTPVSKYLTGAAAVPDSYMWDDSGIRWEPYRNAMDESSLPALNCCVEAQWCNWLLQINHQSGKGFVPTDDDVVALYSATTGYDPTNPATDLGSDMAKVAAYMVATGIRGHKADQIAWVDFTNLAEFRQAMKLFDGLSIGVRIPMSLDFLGLDIWDAQPSGGSAINHNIRAVMFDANYVYCISWGRKIKLTWAFIRQNTYAAIAAISLDMLNAQGKDIDGLDLAQLRADIKAATPSWFAVQKDSLVNWLAEQQESARIAAYVGGGLLVAFVIYMFLSLALRA